MSLRLRDTIAVLSLLIAVGAVQAAFEFDTTCTTCANKGDVGPFIELGFSAYAIQSADDFPADLSDQALLDRFEVLQAETRAVLLRSSRVTVSQGRVVEFTIDPPSGTTGDGYPEMKAALTPALLEGGSIEVNVQVSMSGESGTVTGPQGERMPIRWSEQVQTAPAVVSGGTTAVPVSVRIGPNPHPIGEQGHITLALLMSPTVIGDVAAKTAAAPAPMMQIDAQSVEVLDGEALDAALADDGWDIRAWWAALASSGKASVINNPRFTVAPGGQSSVPLGFRGGADAGVDGAIESELTVAAETHVDGGILLSGHLRFVDGSATLIRMGDTPHQLPVRKDVSFESMVAAREALLVDLSHLGGFPTDRRTLMMLRAWPIE